MTSIAGYTIEQAFTTTGGGRCEWTFARKGAKSYFIKRFLTPKPVVASSLGGARTLERQKLRCRLFETRQNRILAALDGKVGDGGNLIAPIEFFQAHGCYYKVTERLDAKGVTAEAVPTLPAAQQLILLRSAANSLRMLHASGIVHGDLKTDNILIRDRDGGLLTACLIDFDDSYFAHEPPQPPEDFVLDPPYAAPETFEFIAARNSETARRLSTPSDIFALGIVFHEYLSGQKPVVTEGRTRNLGEALIYGLPYQTSLPPRWRPIEPLLHTMLSTDPAARPAIADVLDTLKRIEPAGEPAAPPKLVINVRPRSARLTPKDSAG